MIEILPRILIIISSFLSLLVENWHVSFLVSFRHSCLLTESPAVFLCHSVYLA